MGSLLGEINKNLEKNNFGDITKIMEFVKDKENSEYFSGKYGKEVLNKLNESQTLMINNILNGNTDNIPDSFKTKVDDIMKKKNIGGENNEKIKFIIEHLNKNNINNFEELDAETIVGGGKKNLKIKSNTELKTDIFTEAKLSMEIEKLDTDNNYMTERLETLLINRTNYRYNLKNSTINKLFRLHTRVQNHIDGYDKEEEKNESFSYDINEVHLEFFDKKRIDLQKKMEKRLEYCLFIHLSTINAYLDTKKKIIKFKEIRKKKNNLLEKKEVKLYLKEVKNLEEKVKQKRKETENIKKRIQTFESTEKDYKLSIKDLNDIETKFQNFRSKQDNDITKDFFKKKTKENEITDILKIRIYDYNEYNASNQPKENNIYHKEKLIKDFIKLFKEELKYILNEIELTAYFSISITEEKEDYFLNLILYVFICVSNISKTLNYSNTILEEIKTNNKEEIAYAKTAMEKYNSTLKKIAIIKDKEKFKEDMKYEKFNLYLMEETLHNINEDIVINETLIDECSNFIFFINYNYNYVFNYFSIKSSKVKLLSGKHGAIDISDMLYMNSLFNPEVTYNKINNILDKVIKFRNNIYNSIIRINKKYKESKKNKLELKNKIKRTKFTKKLDKKLLKKINIIDKRQEAYGVLVNKYKEMERPMDILVDYGVIRKQEDKGILKYVFYKPMFDNFSIKMDKKLKTKLDKINSFEKVIKSK